MRAVLCTDFNGIDALTPGDAPAPVPAADEVLIAVNAASVSYMDKLMCEGGYQMRPELPYVPGTEAAGTVLAVGDAVEGYAPGDRVAAQVWYGGYAEKLVAKHWRCAHVPDGVDDHVAASVLHNYLAAYAALVDRCALQAGETLLVTGATGGVGMAVLDLGRMLGAKVIAAVGSSAKADLARSMGAAEVVDYRSATLKEDIRALTGGVGLDVCIDMIGGATFQTLARVMAWGGRLAPVGFVGGDIPALPMNLPLLKSYSVVGVFSGAWLDQCPEEAAHAGAKVFQWIADGKLHPRVDRVLPLDEAADAMRILHRREVAGRIVLDVKNPNP